MGTPAAADLRPTIVITLLLPLAPGLLALLATAISLIVSVLNVRLRFPGSASGA